MICNVDFLIAGLVILLLVLWYFLGQKRAEDLNNQVFFSLPLLEACTYLQNFSAIIGLFLQRDIME